MPLFRDQSGRLKHYAADLKDKVGGSGGVLPVPVRGQVLIADAVPTWVGLAIGAAATYLRSNGTDPSWVAATAFDDFTQYTLLAGRAGAANNTTLSTTIGGTLYGSSAAGQTLTLRSTSNATLGTIELNDATQLWSSIPAATGTTNFLQAITTTNFSTSGITLRFLNWQPTYTFSGATPANLVLARVAGTSTYTTNGAGTTIRGIVFSPGANTEANNVTMPQIRALDATPTISCLNGTAPGTSGDVIGVHHVPSITAASAGTGYATANLTAINDIPTLIASNATSTITITTRRGLYFQESTGGITGTLTITTQAAVDITDLTRGTTNLSVRSAGAAVQLRHAGPGVFGANAAPGNTSVGLEVQSTTRMLLPSRMTTVQRDAITPIDGMLFYNATTLGHQGRQNGAWVDIPGSGGSSSWSRFFMVMGA